MPTKKDTHLSVRPEDKRDKKGMGFFGKLALGVAIGTSFGNVIGSGFDRIFPPQPKVERIIEQPKQNLFSKIRDTSENIQAVLEEAIKEGRSPEIAVGEIIAILQQEVSLKQEDKEAIRSIVKELFVKSSEFALEEAGSKIMEVALYGRRSRLPNRRSPTNSNSR